MLGSRPGAAQTPPPASDDEMRQAHLLLHDYEKSGLGWFWSTDGECRIEYLSECIAERLGKSREELAGRPFHSLFILELDEQDQVERTLPLMMSTHKTFSGLPVRAATEEAEVWWAISGRPQFDASGEFSGFLGNGADITDSRQSHRDASRLAMFDTLTGLANRHHMTKRLDVTLAAYRAAKRSCALLMIDLDRFKQVNDTLGHPAGDELLRQVGQRLREAMEKHCQNYEIGRLGGDEFQIMLPDLDDRGGLGEIGKAIISTLSQPYAVEGSRCTIGASVGIAVAPYDGASSEELVRSADLALYAAKGGGRGQFRFYSSDLHAQAERRRQIEEDLRGALVRNEIWLAYQPVVETKANTVVALEASLRWTHPELGEVAPDIFMPIAEERNLLGALGDWALKAACDAAIQWPGNVRVAVNVLPTQFGNTGFPSAVTQALTHSGLAPERLELELNESIFAGADNSTGQMFDSLKVLGVRFSLDRFGSGQSALGYLRKGTFDKIKIDQSFIAGVTERDSRNIAIIKSIVGLAESLGMETAADGIEAEDELGMMRELGISQVQGCIYASALTGEDVSEAMSSGEWVIEPSGPSKYRTDRKAVFRKIGLIHEDYRYDATMRNLSRTGCMVEGLIDVPAGTSFVVDMGDGQMAVATVRRSSGSMQGLEFEMPLVDNGAGGLCTRHRVSPYVLAAAGLQFDGAAGRSSPFGTPKFAQASDAVLRAGRKEARPD